LLGNAVKFSPEGSTIAIRMQHDERCAVVTIRDHGTGVPEEELDTIFDKFIQSSRTRTGAGGTGLGLAICRAIIEAHEGRIWAENASDGGAVFSIALPLARAGAGPAPLRTAGRAEPESLALHTA
jgi:signal transduction histidine kinase